MPKSTQSFARAHTKLTKIFLSELALEKIKSLLPHIVYFKQDENYVGPGIKLLFVNPTSSDYTKALKEKNSWHKKYFKISPEGYFNCHPLFKSGKLVHGKVYTAVWEGFYLTLIPKKEESLSGFQKLGDPRKAEDFPSMSGPVTPPPSKLETTSTVPAKRTAADGIIELRVKASDLAKEFPEEILSVNLEICLVHTLKYTFPKE